MVSEVIGILTIPFLATTYVYDRWILEPDTMKKKFVIILGVQTFLIFVLYLYAFVQKAKLDEQLRYSVTDRIHAEQVHHELLSQMDSLRRDLVRCRDGRVPTP